MSQLIGLGYVGLPLVIEFCRAGFKVTGFDVDTDKIKHAQGREKLHQAYRCGPILTNDFRENFQPTGDFFTAERNGLYHHLRSHSAEQKTANRICVMSLTQSARLPKTWDKASLLFWNQQHIRGRQTGICAESWKNRE